MKINDIFALLEELCPLSLQESWDHSGLQIGNVNKQVENILICLNVDEHTINQAIKNKCNLIISHHPLLFHSIHTIDLNKKHSKNIEKVIKNDICVISLHTNYDKTRMNTILLECLGCLNIKAIDDVGILRVGDLKESLKFNDFIHLLKQTFGLKYIRYVGTKLDLIQKICICAGSGHDEIEKAFEHCDVYITGDLTYTHAMSIIQHEHKLVIELPHFIEEIFKIDISKHLPMKCIIADEEDYFTII